ncbi:two-component system, NtrC family, sensor histidine kinase PilS [Gammaproteobacteria bacterium]
MGSKELLQSWRALRFFNYYRFTLAIFLLFLGTAKNPLQPLGASDPLLFFIVTYGYLLFSLISIATLYWQKPKITIQVQLQSLGDVVALTLLIHASGGLSSGLGILLVVAVAGDALLMEGRLAHLLAAIATLAVLIEQSATEFMGFGKESNSTQAGLLGASFFATAILARLLAQRMRESEDLAHQRGVDLANLTELNAHIIQRMDAGVVVVDVQNRVRLLNTSAWYLLGMPADTHRDLTHLCPELARQVHAWRIDHGMEPRIFRSLPEGNEILPRFSVLGQQTAQTVQTAGTDLLIVLENATALAEQAQQMKLAALGRLTASIAHEIRNPLGAVSHAAQLLDESPDLGEADHRLTRIIYDQARRLNSVIENVLLLSRREPIRLEELPLAPLLDEMVEDLRSRPEAKLVTVTVCVSPPNLVARFDISQIRQVLDNLCRNALRHARREDGTLHLHLEAGSSQDQGTWLEVMDNGPGIPTEIAYQIFEPFFTTRRDGTGLGLYLARELCEANLAHLSYQSVSEGGSRFRIRFSRSPKNAISTLAWSITQP